MKISSTSATRHPRVSSRIQAKHPNGAACTRQSVSHTPAATAPTQAPPTRYLQLQTGRRLRLLRQRGQTAGATTGRSQLQSPHHLQPASLAAPGHSQRRTRHASRTEPRPETEPGLRSPDYGARTTEPGLRSPDYGARTTEVDSHSTSTFSEGKRHPLSPKRQQG